LKNINYKNKISTLDWGIIISSLLLLLAVFLPQSIWLEEEEYKAEGRKRMTDIANAQEFYFEITGEYTMDGKHLFKLVEAAMDSLIADSLFIGSREIKLEDKSYSVNLERGFEVRVDTTFSIPEELYFTYDDTLYSVGLRNIDSGGIDTLFVNIRDLAQYQLDENFKEIIASDIVKRSEYRTDYLRKKYHLDEKFLSCPVTGESYVFEIDTTGDDSVFKVTSPLHLLKEPYEEARFGIFTFEAGDHGFIHDGQKSWAE